MKEKKLTGAYYQMKAAGATGEILLYQEIGDPSMWGDATSAEGFIKDLKSLGNVLKIDLRVNSPGGNVFHGNAIYNALDRHPAKITAWVDGLAASIASVICMAADEIVMADNAIMMIHDAWGVVAGTAAEMRKNADVLDEVTSGIANSYVKRSGMDIADVRRLMGEETWMGAEEAVKNGLADRVVGGMKIAACVFDPKRYRFKNTPEIVAAAIEAAPKRDKFAAQFQSLKLDEIRGRMSA